MSIKTGSAHCVPGIADCSSEIIGFSSLNHASMNTVDIIEKSCHNFPMTLKAIEKAVRLLKPGEQRKLLRDLPLLIKLSSEDMARLKASEKSFAFWNNPEDAIYDTL